MDSYKKALTFAVELFGRDHVNSESSDGLFETVINLSEYRHVGNGYKPSIIRLSYDGSYYWMDIDDYKWEFDDNANQFEQDSCIYLKACREGKLVERGTLFKKLEIN